jgi:drug/metabolite transporter (DMT)-like permease
MWSKSSPLAGMALAVLAALSFGLTVPVLQWAGSGVGALTCAAALYAGAGLAAFASTPFSNEPRTTWTRPQLHRLAAVTILGAAIAPTALAFGTQRAGALNASLLLNAEAVFTVLLASLWYREPIGTRVWLALTFMALGGVTLTLAGTGSTKWNGLGVVSVLVATLCWALDNVLSRELAEKNPFSVVARKGMLGAGLTGALALWREEPWPQFQAAVVLLLCGATGYGFSLQLYLFAQRRIGAARTGSIFALAPFVGAAVAVAVGRAAVGPWTGVSALLFLLGVLLHFTERHAHSHIHPATIHTHMHRHDDGHHTHTHVPPVLGEHAHAHAHQHLEHHHPHAPDVHHSHRHLSCMRQDSVCDCTRPTPKDPRNPAVASLPFLLVDKKGVTID